MSRSTVVANLELEMERLSQELADMALHPKPHYTWHNQRVDAAAYRSSLSTRINEIIEQIAKLQDPVRVVTYKRPV